MTTSTTRSNALTVTAPLAWGRYWWCRVVHPILRILAMWSPLARLRFIHFAGWIVFRDLPGPKPPGWRPRPGMIFVSDYDGDPTEYLTAFAAAIPRGVHWSFSPFEGFPGSVPSRRLKEYVETHRYDDILSYSAYPGATVRDIDAALDVVQRLEALRPHCQNPGSLEFSIAYHRLLTAVSLAPPCLRPSMLSGIRTECGARPTVHRLTVLTPFIPGRHHEVLGAIQALQDREPNIFDDVGGVHFARMVLVDIVGNGWDRRRRSRTTRKHVLLSAWVDGPVEDFTVRLVTALGPQADQIWAGCEGYPGADQPEQVASWLCRLNLPAPMILGNHQRATVDTICQALARREQAIAALLAVQDLDPPAAAYELLCTLWPEDALCDDEDLAITAPGWSS